MATFRMNLADLSLLENCGIRIDDTGKVVDWADWPASNARSFDQDDSHEGSNRRNPFTAQEDAIIREWCEAAEQEGVRGTAIFEQLECLYPRHTWRAYEGRWRKTLRPQTVQQTSTDISFPGLDAAVSPQQGPEASIDLITVNYADQRVETGRVILEKLALSDDAELARFLQLPWVIEAYVELADASLSVRQAADEHMVAVGNTMPKLLNGRSQHNWKVDRVMELLQTYGSASRYCQDQNALDKSSWTEDDHDLRFMLRIIRSGVQEGRWWHSVSQERGLRTVCEQVLWLLLWFRWLWKPSAGQSIESNRLQRKKGRWLALLDESKVNLGAERPLPDIPSAQTEPRDEPASSLSSASPSTDSCPPSPTITVCSDRPLSNNITDSLVQNVDDPDDELLTDIDEWYDACSEVADLSGREHTTKGISVAERPLDDAQKAWMSEEIRQIYLNNRDRRLAAWGVTAMHQGTCLLLPADWQYMDPVSLLDNPSAWPSEEFDKTRLGLSIGPVRPLWGRAAAWFETWPRTRKEVIQFTDPNDILPQGSHLCHHGLCINPTHIVYEERAKNLTRTACRGHAQGLRTYQFPIPAHCKIHRPPCLLHHAALTPFEAFAIQFSILRQARNIAAGPKISRPAHHPVHYQTFEYRLPTEEPLASIRIEPANLISTPLPGREQSLDRFRRRCRFCIYPRTWGTLTAYWSHIRVEHIGESQNEVLDEVAAAGEAYHQWAYRKFYDLERCNPATWAKIIQARQPDFSWETFTGWRLHKDRVYKGRRERDERF